MYRCPTCSFTYPLGGLCPSPYHAKTIMQELPEEEDNREMKNIEYKGNTDRFHGQKKGRLVDVEVKLAKEISCIVCDAVGKEVPRNSVKLFIVLTFIGENGVPYQDVVGYGGARVTNLKKDLGKWFDIDSPATETQTEIELKAEEVKE